jgi:hypothetical protein
MSDAPYKKRVTISKILLMMVLVAAVISSMPECAGNRKTVVKAVESRRQNIFKKVIESNAALEPDGSTTSEKSCLKLGNIMLQLRYLCRM